MNDVVVIRKTPENPNVCSSNDFLAGRGGEVIFLFPAETSATIRFHNGKSPFDGAPSFRLLPNPATGNAAFAKKTVKKDQPDGHFTYEVSWDNDAGSGNGSGDVSGSRGG